MKALETALITDGKSMPIKSGTLDFLRYSFQELFAELVQEIYPALDPTQVNVLRGATYSQSGSTYTLQPGAVLYGGEIFFITSVQTLTPAPGSNAILAIDTTYYTGDGYNADPVIFSDGNPYNVHQIRTIILAEDVLTPAGNRVCNLNALVYHAISNVGEIKMYCGDLSVFSNTGLGLPTGGWLGWALCNGQNGTIDLRGKFVVGYYAGGDPSDANNDYASVGAQGGEKYHKLLEAELAQHNHGISAIRWSTTNGYEDNGGSGPGVTNSFTPATDNAGSNMPHENRPPYYTLAFVQRIV